MINNSTFSWDAFQQAPIIGIIRGLPKATVLKIADTYLKAGLTTLEVTMNTADVLDIIAHLRSQFPELNVGAGTVCTKIHLKNAINAGAQFIVTPILEEEVVKAAVDAGHPIFPGAYTPTEIYKASLWGAPAVKVFPATQLGPSYIKDVLAPLNELKLIPTGGVTADNLSAFFAAGAFGVGMGSSLLNKKYIRANDFESLKTHFSNIKAQLDGFQ